MSFFEKVQDSHTEDKIDLELKEQHAATTRRLRDGMISLSRRTGINLALGIVAAAFGVVILLILIVFFRPANDTNTVDALATFAPFLSAVVTIEAFAYFFLRLYSTGLMETKYFQNELTNVDARFMALRAAMHLEDKEALKDVLVQFARTERNYVLQKGQTTVELERSKAEVGAIASLTQALLKALDRKP